MNKTSASNSFAKTLAKVVFPDPAGPANVQFYGAFPLIMLLK